MLCLQVCVCPHMRAQCCEGQKRASHSLELEMWMAVDHYVVLGMELFSARITSALTH